MTVRPTARLHATDASFLPSPSFPGSSDQYLTFAFETSGTSVDPLDTVRDLVRRRTSGIDLFHCTVVPSPLGLDHPQWVRTTHDAEGRVGAATTEPLAWDRAQDELARLMATRLDPEEATWHLHVLPVVTGVPGSSGTATIVVLQICHALTDGRGAGVMARTLFGPAGERPTVPAVRVLHRRPGTARAVAADGARMIGRGLQGASTAVRSTFPSRRATTEDTPDPPARHPVSFASVPPALDRAARILVIPVERLRRPGRTVTLTALAAVSIAMEEAARRRGAGVPTPDRPALSPTAPTVPPSMAAHVTVALPDDAPWGARNRFLPAMVDLGIGTHDVADRLDRIATSLAAGRRRALHPAILRRYETGNVVPRPIMRAFGPTPQPPSDSVLAHTSFSSVHRGPANLSLGEAPVLFTAGFPALSLASSLSHGVYTIGDTATMSVLWSPGSLPDMDGYVDLLGDALSTVTA